MFLHPLRGAIRHGIYQIPPGFLAALLAFVVAGSLVEMDAIRLSRLGRWLSRTRLSTCMSTAVRILRAILRVGSTRLLPLLVSCSSAPPCRGFHVHLMLEVAELGGRQWRV